MERICITTNSKLEPEKRYIFKVIFEHFWDIPYQLQFSDQVGATYVFEFPGNPNTLVVPDVFLHGEHEHWIKTKQVPALPLATIALPNSPANTIAALFQSKETNTTYNLDIPGSVFYMITLFEELFIEEKDTFGRLNYFDTLLYKTGLYQRPLANEYLDILWHLLTAIEPTLTRKEREYEVNLSHDVDSPLGNNYPFINFIKSCGSDIFLRRSISTLAKRVASRMLGSRKLDPHNTFDFLMDTSTALGLKSEFNFIAIDGKRGKDGAYDIQQPFFRSLLQSIKQKGHIIGFHPGFQTYNDAERTAFELNRLKAVLQEVGIATDKIGGRFHYLRRKHPESWAILDGLGLEFDSTIGYGSASHGVNLGFRAGICYPYPLFDFKKRKALQLIEVPLIAMDVCAFQLKKFPVYLQHITTLVEKVKAHQGTMTFLVHNNYVITPKQKKEYTTMVEAIL